MIIDIHSYVLASGELYRQKTNLLAERGWGDTFAFPDADAVHRYGDITVQIMDQAGVDIRFIGPRPYHLLHAEKPASLVHTWIGMTNDVIAMQCAQHPGRLRGVGGLPQVAGAPIDGCLDELDRCAGRAGFVGVMINTDPGEGLTPTPGMGDPYWYPLYERLVAHDMPAIVVGGATRQSRLTYRTHYITESSIAALSILENSEIFERFAGLKLVMTYGGGSLPYQVGRWRARNLRRRHRVDFDTQLRRLWFDTAVHSPDAMDMLLQVCGIDRCMFGTTQPGAASTTNPETGQPYDHLVPVIEAIDWLTSDDRRDLFERNARTVFKRL